MAENSTLQICRSNLVMTAWEPLPTYWKVFNDIIRVYGASWQKYTDSSYSFPGDIHKDVRILLNFTWPELSLLVSLSVGFTVVRSCLTRTVLSPLSHRLKLNEESIAKMPESIWKFCYYGCVWSLAFNVIVWSGKYEFFQKPSTVWDGWSADMSIPFDIYSLYIIQGSYYVHGLYALFFQDAWRKDSVVMGLHHVVTLVLIWFSSVCRYHNIGVLVMFFHDLCDIQLEFAKINVYLKIRDGRMHKLHDILAGISFASMIVTWFLLRLYYTPLKVLYASSTVFLERNFLPDYILLMNTMLCLLTLMNAYWFSQLLNLLYKILTGELREVDDIREYDVVEKIERKTTRGDPPSKKVD